MVELYGEKEPFTKVPATLHGEEKYVPPQGYSDDYDHFATWAHSIRTRQPLTEDPIFGYRAAGAALLSNLSYETSQVARWDPEAMKLL
jgi:hypothetical protein